MWVAPQLPPTDRFYQPIPDKTVGNMLGIAERNEGVDVRLWVDSRRITGTQLEWIQEKAGNCRSRNMSLLDLCSIPEYANGPLYAQPDTNPNWRIFKASLIWQQVDAARILVCLAGLEEGYQQVVYSDADITNMVINSKNVQPKLKKYGIIISGSDKFGYENQLFGFEPRRQDWCKQLYEDTRKSVSDLTIRRNGFAAFSAWIDGHVMKGDIILSKIIFNPEYDGTEARHPGLG